jgi:hypothetical protein
VLDGGDEPVEELDGLVWVTAGHLSLLGMIEPSGHNFFLTFRLNGLFGFNEDCVEHLPLGFGCDPSGHILLVGDIGGGAKVCVHDGSFGFLEQSTTDGGVPEVQLSAAHVVPLLSPPPDVGIDLLPGWIIAEVLSGGLNNSDDRLDVLVDVVLVPLTGIVEFTTIVALGLTMTVNVADLEAGL